MRQKLKGIQVIAQKILKNQLKYLILFLKLIDIEFSHSGFIESRNRFAASVS